MAIEFIDLVLDNGELVRLSCRDKDLDEVYAALENSMKRKDWWSSNIFNGCSAEYLGLRLDRVNMARVIGTR